METRANYVLIGAFTLFGILGSLLFFLWLGKVQVDRQYAYYDILFDSVSGLGDAGDVRFNGLPVGQVVNRALDRENPSKVRVRVEIDAATPVKSDTVVTLELQGVTGVSYVAFNGGSPDAPLLKPAPGAEVPVIIAEHSVIESLFEGGPELLRKAIALLEDINAMITPENRTAVSNTLANLESASGKLDAALADFSSLSADISKATGAFETFTGDIGDLSTTAKTTLLTADETLKTTQTAIEQARLAIDQATGVLASAQTTFDSTNGLITDRLPGLIDRIESTATAVETVVTDVGGKAGSVVGKIDQISDIAISRLTEAEATLAKLDTALETATITMKSVDETSRSVGALVNGEGAALVADARRAINAANEAIVAANRVIADDLPPIIADVRSATGNVNTLVSEATANLSTVTGRIDGIATNAESAIQAATETFRTANATLEAITGTMTTADQTLVMAQGTFTSVNRVLDEDVGIIVSDLRGSIAGLNAALEQVSGDLPLITAEVLQTLGRATNFVDNLDRMMTDNAEEIQVFLQAGLPQFTRFVQEGTRLVTSLQRLTAKIERDPARFLLGTQSPEYRR